MAAGIQVAAFLAGVHIRHMQHDCHKCMAQGRALQLPGGLVLTCCCGAGRHCWRCSSQIQAPLSPPSMVHARSERVQMQCREKWEVGAREDWRFADMRARWGRAWPLVSFFMVYLIQQGMLVGLTLPLYAVFSSSRGWQHGLDSLATVGCITGTAPVRRIRRGNFHAHRCGR